MTDTESPFCLIASVCSPRRLSPVNGTDLKLIGNTCESRMWRMPDAGLEKAFIPQTVCLSLSLLKRIHFSTFFSIKKRIAFVKCSFGVPPHHYPSTAED